MSYLIENPIPKSEAKATTQTEKSSIQINAIATRLVQSTILLSFATIIFFVLLSLNNDTINKVVNVKVTPVKAVQKQSKALIDVEPESIVQEPLNNLKDEVSTIKPRVKSVADLAGEDNITPSPDVARGMAVGKAIELLSSGELQEGIKLLKEIIAKDPKNDQALFELGMVYMLDTKEIDKAKSVIQKAVKLNPDNEMYVSELFALFTETGKVEDGIEFIQERLDENPDSATLSAAIGRLYSAAGNNEEAIYNFEKAAENSENPSIIYSEITALYDSKGDTQKAVTSFAKAVSAIKTKISNTSSKDEFQIATSNEQLDYMNKEYVRLLLKNKDLKKAQLEINKIDAIGRLSEDRGWLALKKDVDRASSKL